MALKKISSFRASISLNTWASALPRQTERCFWFSEQVPFRSHFNLNVSCWWVINIKNLPQECIGCCEILKQRFLLMEQGKCFLFFWTPWAHLILGMYKISDKKSRILGQEVKKKQPSNSRTMTTCSQQVLPTFKFYWQNQVKFLNRIIF
jgi:hypothetical protein